MTHRVPPQTSKDFRECVLTFSGAWVGVYVCMHRGVCAHAHTIGTFTYICTYYTHTHTRHTHRYGMYLLYRIGSVLMDAGVPGSAVCRLEYRRAYTVISVWVWVWVKGWRKPNIQCNNGEERAPAHSVLLCAGLPLVPAGGPPTRSRAVCSAQFTDQLFTSSTSTSQTHLEQSLTKRLGTPQPIQIHKENEPAHFISPFIDTGTGIHTDLDPCGQREREREKPVQRP